MVDGQLRDSRRGGVVTDLDGTLLRGNSLKWILKAGLSRMLRRGRIPSVLAVLALGGLAYCRLVSHETMKYGALRLFGDDPGLMEEMHRLGIERRNEDVVRILAEAESRGDRILLASAASESYIRELWDGEYIASPFGGPDLRGEQKLQAVKKWLAENDLRFEAFLTDHYHDLPLAEYAYHSGAIVYLVNPTDESRRRFDAAGIRYT
ncbi:MAG: haloacid dehalogenase-like hydrolase, partial [Muribaculaceae bacterium]|nr:haloacid dehalogenase-like hydrolase [Muribaculaceae bacterium]